MLCFSFIFITYFHSNRFSSFKRKDSTFQTKGTWKTKNCNLKGNKLRYEEILFTLALNFYYTFIYTDNVEREREKRMLSFDGRNKIEKGIEVGIALCYFKLNILYETGVQTYRLRILFDLHSICLCRFSTLCTFSIVRNRIMTPTKDKSIFTIFKYYVIVLFF